MGKEELCCECDEPTGRSGKSEDSLYLYSIAGNEFGPLCEDCYKHFAEHDSCWYTAEQLEEDWTVVW